MTFKLPLKMIINFYHLQTITKIYLSFKERDIRQEIYLKDKI